MLVLGSVDLTAQGVSRFPEDFGVGQVGSGCFIVRHAGLRPILYEFQNPGDSRQYTNCGIPVYWPEVNDDRRSLLTSFGPNSPVRRLYPVPAPTPSNFRHFELV